LATKASKPPSWKVRSRTDGDREARLVGKRIPGHVGVAGAVHGDASGHVLPAAADIACIDQRRAVGFTLATKAS